MVFEKGNIPWIKGKCHSDITKQKIGEAGKGNKYMLGKHLSKETRERMSESHKGLLLGDKNPSKRLEVRLKIGLKSKGRKHSQETIQKIRQSSTGRKHTPETIEKMRKVTRSEEFREHISRVLKGRHPSNESRRKMSEVKAGYVPWIVGKHHSEEARRKMSKAKKGRYDGSKHPWFGKHHTSETKRKLSEAFKGEKSSFWKGGISFEPYSLDWTETLKCSIRERDKYTCQLCSKQQSDVAFCVHHIDYNKKNCDYNNLITLCGKCHNKTNNNREYWIDFFSKKLFISQSLFVPLEYYSMVESDKQSAHANQLPMKSQVEGHIKDLGVQID